MMKGGFEVVHWDFTMIQPHCEFIWDFTSTTLSSTPRQQLTLETRCINSDRNELSESKQLIDYFSAENTETNHRRSLQAVDTLMAKEDNFAPLILNDFRPRETVSSEELQWNNRLDERGFSLIMLLLECAVAISIENLGEAHRMLLEMTQMASPYALSCAERVVAYFSKAMSSRFAHFTSNQAILEAFHGRDRVHIIDLDIMQGLQWPALFHILATRMEGPPHVTMTGFGNSMELLVKTGKQLSNFAKRLGMSFEFHPVAKKFGEIDVTSVQHRRGETLAVHWLQHSLYDATGPDWKTMRLMEQLAPRVITLVEQDLSHGGLFLDRFVASLHYYSTMFDSLGAYLPADDPNRHRIEHCLLYREINNILAIGGPARSGEDKLKQWRRELAARNCFMQVPMSSNSMAQAQLILNIYPPAHGYRLVQGDGTLRLGWKDISLFTASAWTSHSSR
ncbi:Protein SCARECROW [Hibiscus syriacus]|uniref:Protein SCARECROW n=1 Tax=Hibiscus syriacus TaxID=106335 RepID=A0A6A3CP54_HIBSY|nr:Protein SCARECROW [Hibiscus syriacus]